MSMHGSIDPKLDLFIERTVSAPRERLWAAWTKPEHLKKWFTPRPWSTAECEVDLRPGGLFRVLMRGPEGEESHVRACYLEIVPNERLVWTIALEPGFRPVSAPTVPMHDAAGRVPPFTAIITFEPHGAGTRYVALAKHRDEAGCKQHADMGFAEGWGQCTDQLIELAGKL